MEKLSIIVEIKYFYEESGNKENTILSV